MLKFSRLLRPFSLAALTRPLVTSVARPSCVPLLLSRQVHQSLVRSKMSNPNETAPVIPGQAAVDAAVAPETAAVELG